MKIKIDDKNIQLTEQSIYFMRSTKTEVMTVQEEALAYAFETMSLTKDKLLFVDKDKFAKDITAIINAYPKNGTIQRALRK